MELLSTGIWYCCLQWPQAFIEIPKHKKANSISTDGLELATYNITIEWISGAHNKVADSLISRCQGHCSNMLVTSTPDGPATCSHSKTCNTTNTTLLTDPTTTLTNDKENASPHLTKYWKDTLRLMQKMDPFCKWISKRLLGGKAPLHEIDTFTHITGLIYKHVMDSNQRFLALVIPNSWHFTVLVEAHDKLGHQEFNRTYDLVKC